MIDFDDFCKSLILQAKPTPVERSKPATGNKPSAAGKQPPILAFKPELKQRVAKGAGPSKPGQRKTALVIACHETDVEGEVSVSEGDLITITGEGMFNFNLFFIPQLSSVIGYIQILHVNKYISNLINGK